MLLIFCFVLSILFPATLTYTPEVPNEAYVSDACGWQGSGSLMTGSDRSVTPIYLRCAQGRVRWLFPKGGLRVVFKLGTNGDSDFHGCIRIHRNVSQSARIYVEGKHKLFQLYSHSDNQHPDLWRCFVSSNQFAALFIETDPNVQYTRSNSLEHLTFDYELQASPNPKLGDEDLDDCKPCSDEDLLRSYCSAEFVMKGQVTYYQNRPEIKFTEFTVKPTKIERFPQDIDDNELPEDSEDYEKILRRPLKCGSRASARIEYMFLGRHVLGSNMIECVTDTTHWRRIALRALAENRNQCQIAL